MSENIIQQVASGNAPQPAAEAAQPSDYAQIEKDAVAGLSGELNPEKASEENIDDLDKELIDAAEKAGDLSKKEAQSLKKKLMLKVDGQEIEEEVDLADEEYLKRELQKSKAFDKRSKEYSAYKSQVDQLLQMLQNDPETLLEKMGLNVDEFAEKRLTKKLEQMKKSPEQIKNEEMQAELEKLRKEKSEIEEARTKAEMERLRNEQSTQITNEIVEALSDVKSILPKQNPIVLQRIAQTMLYAMQNGYPNVKAKDVIPMVEKQWRKELNDVFAGASEDTIESLVGKEALTKYRKSIIAKNKNQLPTPQKVNTVDTGKSHKPQEKQVDMYEAREKFKKMFRPV